MIRARRIATQVADTTVGVIAGADAVIRQAGLTTRDGRISRTKLGLAVLRPRRSGGRIIRAAATEIDRRRNGPERSDRSSGGPDRPDAGREGRGPT